ncbi:squalene synthase HpnC [Parasulfuritortus cantonensis]|uniref:Squalene synthase HpnC n=2 Tax=Parasulfuritortus cantonensis TaxID=2528202 RepID=A0A4R1B168_9PROT|nr:squalene synthase HpnC [Parasulfuritortus cantonensis]
MQTSPGHLVKPGHYENFPVASLILPRRLRRPVRAIYAFARAADDIADEGEAPAEQRLADLQSFRSKLRALECGEVLDDPIFGPLGTAIRGHDLPFQPFHDLLDAFSQDCTKTRYGHFGEVMDYCRKSANPIGRLLLMLYGDRDARHQAWADGVCSALQLINFLQDVAIDQGKGRIYLPQDEMAKFGVSERQIAEGRVDGLWQQFMKTQIERARRMLKAGAPLGLALKGRIGVEMRLIILGGERILYKLGESRGDVFNQRPVLTLTDWLAMLRGALWPKRRKGGGDGCSSGSCNSGCGR